MMPIDKFTEAAERVGGKPGRRSTNGWIRFPHPCSPHGDAALSFAITEKPDGSVDISSKKDSYDHDACLAALGLTRKDYFPDEDIRGVRVTSAGTCTHQYEYADRKGKLIGAVARTYQGEKKLFPQGRYENGKWVKGLDGIKLPLFEEAKVADAIARGETIYITEGEKDTLALWKAGYAATTKSGGSQSPWHPHLVNALNGADIVLIVDKDEPGLNAAVAGYVALSPVAKSFRIVEAKEGKDAYDHLAAGFTVADFVDRSDAIPKRETLTTTTLNGTFQNVQPTYLWEPYLPIGKAILADADGGVGKTSFALAIAAGLSIGQLPNGGGSCTPCKTLYLMGDNDTAEEMETVYRANGGKEGSITYCCGAFPLTADAIELVRNTVQDGGFKFLVIDPFLYFLNGVVRDINDSVQVLPYCRMIGDLAAQTGITILAIRHVPKSAMQIGGNFTGMGTVQFRNSFRGCLLLRKNPEDYRMIVVTDDKGSLLNRTGDPMAFRREGNEVQWIVDFDDPFSKKTQPNPVGRPHEQMDAAILAICSLMATPMRTKELQAKIIPAHCSRPTFFRAIEKMGIKSRDGFYEMPPTYDPFGDDPQDHVYRGGD